MTWNQYKKEQCQQQNGDDLKADIHGGVLKALLWVLIAGHVLAAFYHHFVLKDGLLNRMRKPLD